METLEETKHAVTKCSTFTGGLHLKFTNLQKKSGKKAKLLFDLSLTFNIHLHYDSALKDCIALMMPDETFLMRFEMGSDIWFEMLIDRVCSMGCETDKIRKPKLSKKIKDEELVEDLVVKNENFFLGKKRLCMYHHTLYIVRKGVVASKDTSPPFCSDDYIAFPVTAISIYGHRNKYFFFRADRCAPTGAGELWFCTDNGKTASSINDKIIRICDRESEKKKVQGRMCFSRSNVPTRSSRSQTHRERSHTQRLSADVAGIKSFGHKLSAPDPGFLSSYFSQQSLAIGKELEQVDKKFLHSQSTVNNGEKERQRLADGYNSFSEDRHEHVDSKTSQSPSDPLDSYTPMGWPEDCNCQSTSTCKRIRSFSSQRASSSLQRNQQADILRNGILMVIGRSGSNSTISIECSSYSHTSSLDIGNSMVLYSATKGVRKVRNYFENPCKKVQSAADFEFPVPPKEKSSSENNEASISSLSLKTTTKRSSTFKIAAEVSYEYERFDSDGTFVKDEQMNLEYATLHCH
ncbi:unnamed protein product [Acanthocheilonema viteae]|uniref:IRS-type PTB domain-containing protein n=1 Tax=Acanthocheilonema viteae TaxID=6277 RepID=A0A498S9P5_ACAVI|nr:unnamed protein product [Acanthocheilonema viteae]